MATKKKTTTTTSKPAADAIAISPPNFETIVLEIEGTSPLLQQAFPQKARAAMRAKMEAGSTAKKGAKREPRNFEDDFKQSQHISEEGWNGIPAAAFRNACIDVCRMVGFKMTHAKMSVFCEADGLDKVDGTPLVKLIAGKPEQNEMPGRLATGVVDIRVRAMWRKWGAKLRLRFDADQFTATDVVNLLARAGEQVGIGEGRPFSKQSNGMGLGTFRIREGK
jgi:hypothetical protein